MKIYVAAKFSQRDELRKLIPILAEKNVNVVSFWITNDELDFHEMSRGELTNIGERDLNDICAANIVVIDTTLPLSEGAGGGREFEAGYGLKKHGQFWRVGPARNPFHHGASKAFTSWEDFIKCLQNQA